MLLLVVAGLSVLGITLISMLASEMDILGGGLAAWTQPIVTVLSICVNTLVFSLIFWLATSDDHAFRDVVPGGLTMAVLLHVMKIAGAAYIDGVVSRTSLTYGVFAVVLGLLAWIYITAALMVMSIELNVVRERRLYPRALMTPFTDNVDLTEADRRAYASYAGAQQSKGFETIEVTFEPRRRRHHLGRRSHGH